MNQGLIPKRYAKALYEAAAQPEVQQLLYTQMRAIAGAFAAEPSLQATMANPFVAAADKAGLIYAAAGCSSKPEAMLQNLVRVLTENGRLGMVRDIAIAYAQLFRTERHIAQVKVTSAAPLTDSEAERLKKLIAAHLGGAQMEFSASVDPDLIGGFTVTIDNERLDASVKNELKQLRLNLLSNK